MKECSGKIGLRKLKYMILGIFLFSQIGFLLTGKQVVFSTKSPLKKNYLFLASRNMTPGNICTSNITPGIYDIGIIKAGNQTSKDAINQKPSPAKNIERKNWVFDGIECSLGIGSKRLPYDNRSFRSLPEKYGNIRWPPLEQTKCGIHGLLRPWAMDAVKKPWMIFVVKSALHHISLRNTIRATWASITSIYNESLTTVFLLGRPSSINESQNWQEALQKENDIFGDILQCDIEDSYENLPKKVLGSFGWLLKQNHTNAFYTMTDDDCLMRISNIFMFFDHLSESEGNGNIYCGFVYDRDNAAIRGNSSKWSMSASQYSARFYPTFCHGGMYTMKKRLLESVYCMSGVTNTSGFHLEDVLITGILREKIGDGDSNIKPVTTKSGKRLEMMYYPWVEDTGRAMFRLRRKWELWSRTLTHYRRKNILQSRNFSQYISRKDLSILVKFWRNNYPRIFIVV